MQTVAVTDANIFIDLFRIDLLSLLFQLELEIHTSREIMEELYDEQQTKLLQYELLVVHDLSEEHWQEIQNLKLNRRFSDADCSVLGLAVLLKASLLTNESLMRRKASQWGLEVHGILWILDCFIERSLIDQALAAEKLQKLMETNAYLPKSECIERLAKWRKS